MDSKRRMMEIHIWNQAFFSQLEEREKLFYWFVITNCNNIGVLEHNPKLTVFHCGGDVDLKSFTDTVNFDKKRIEYLDDSTLWVRDFVRDTWGTIAAKNNLGLSCYKLLVKYNLLDRFISEYPNNINVGSFREAIKESHKGYGELPLPQASPKLDSNIDQVSDKAGTINTIINDNKSISIDTLYQSLVDAIPIPLSDNPDYVYMADIERVAEQLNEEGIKNIEAYLIQAAKNFDWDHSEWDEFAETLIKNEDIPF